LRKIAKPIVEAGYADSFEYKPAENGLVFTGVNMKYEYKKKVLKPVKSEVEKLDDRIKELVFAITIRREDLDAVECAKNIFDELPYTNPDIEISLTERQVWELCKKYPLRIERTISDFLEEAERREDTPHRIKTPGRYYKKILEDELIDTWDEDFLNYWEITREQAENWAERETDIELLLDAEHIIKHLVFLIYIGRPIPIKDIEWLEYVIERLENELQLSLGFPP